jgi:hypothetical protein
MIALTDDDIVFQSEPHLYRVKGVEVRSVTQVLHAAGLCDDFSMVPPDVLRVAQSRGNAVHAACAFLDAGELDISSVDERVWGYVRAYASFRNTLNARTVCTEKQIAACVPTASGRVLPSAGTVDWVAFIGGRRAVIDIKTGQNRSAGVQTAGYKLTWNASNPIAYVYDRYSLRLFKNGVFKLIAEEDPDDEAAYMDALEFAQVDSKMKRWRTKYKN